jgi:hypothetical protein
MEELRNRVESAAPPSDAWDRFVESVKSTELTAFDNDTDEVGFNGLGNDHLMIDYFEPRPQGNETPDSRNRWLSVIAVAATFAVLVGLAVLPGGGSNGVSIDQISPLAEGDFVPYQWSRVSHDEAVFTRDHAQSMSSVTVGGPGFVAVGESGLHGNESRATVWTSVDGIDWDRVPHIETVFGDARMKAVTSGESGLVAVGSATSENGRRVAAVWTSVDGVDWDRVPHDEAVFGESVLAGATMESVIVGGPGFVAVGSDASGQGASSNAVVWTSVDGLVWSRVAHDDMVFGKAEIGRCCTSMSSVTVGDAGLVAVGTDWTDDSEGGRATVWTSVDGTDWSRLPHNEVLSGTMSSVTTGGPGFVAVGSTELDAGHTVAVVWTSVDGIDWARVPHDESVFGGADSPPDRGRPRPRGSWERLCQEGSLVQR